MIKGPRTPTNQETDALIVLLDLADFFAMDQKKVQALFVKIEKLAAERHAGDGGTSGPR